MLAYVYSLPVTTINTNIVIYNIALDPCIAASNGGCDPNAYCIMTGPGEVCNMLYSVLAYCDVLS